MGRTKTGVRRYTAHAQMGAPKRRWNYYGAARIQILHAMTGQKHVWELQ